MEAKLDTKSICFFACLQEVIIWFLCHSVDKDNANSGDLVWSGDPAFLAYRRMVNEKYVDEESEAGGRD